MTRSHLCPSLIINILAQVPLCITVYGCVSVRLGAHPLCAHLNPRSYCCKDNDELNQSALMKKGSVS